MTKANSTRYVSMFYSMYVCNRSNSLDVLYRSADQCCDPPTCLTCALGRRRRKGAGPPFRCCCCCCVRHTVDSTHVCRAAGSSGLPTAPGRVRLLCHDVRARVYSGVSVRWPRSLLAQPATNDAKRALFSVSPLVVLLPCVLYPLPRPASKPARC